MTETMLAEHAQVSRVVFPADFNTALATLEACYQTHGQIWTVVVPKGKVPQFFSEGEARQIVSRGALALPSLSHDTDRPELLLTAIGAYQLVEAAKASARLRQRGIGHRVIYLYEPGRLRKPRSRREQKHVLEATEIEEFFPSSARARVFLTHTRPEPILGMLAALHSGPQTVGLGFRNDGGTLDVAGMLWVNGCSWLHCLQAAAQTLNRSATDFLTPDELRALNAEIAPGLVLKQH